MSISARDLTPRRVRTFRNSPAYELDLCVNGKVVLHVSNEGRGGSNRYHPPKGGDYGHVRRFTDECRADFGDFEPLDSLCSAFADGAKTYDAAVRTFAEFEAAYSAMYGAA